MNAVSFCRVATRRREIKVANDKLHRRVGVATSNVEFEFKYGELKRSSPPYQLSSARNLGALFGTSTEPCTCTWM